MGRGGPVAFFTSIGAHICPFSLPFLLLDCFGRLLRSSTIRAGAHNRAHAIVSFNGLHSPSVYDTEMPDLPGPPHSLFHFDWRAYMRFSVFWQFSLIFCAMTGTSQTAFPYRRATSWCVPVRDDILLWVMSFSTFDFGCPLRLLVWLLRILSFEKEVDVKTPVTGRALPLPFLCVCFCASGVLPESVGVFVDVGLDCACHICIQFAEWRCQPVTYASLTSIALGVAPGAASSVCHSPLTPSRIRNVSLRVQWRDSS